jgi:MFS family permease
MKPMFKRFKEMKNKYQRFVMPAALVLGFVVDTFTLNQIDQTFDNAILLVHLLLVSSMITLLTTRGTRLGERLSVEKRKNIFITIMLFSFGGLFSGFVIFYVRSGSLLSSWPFILLMLGLMLLTEFKKKYYRKIVFQITILYIALLAHLAFLTPLALNRMGVSVFILSSLVATVVIYFFGRLLLLVNPPKLRHYWRDLIVRILIILAVFHGLYFTNIIPPIPLSMKYKAVYYDIEKTSNFSYNASYEETPWWNVFRKRSREMKWQQGEDIYVFTQIFAPARLNTKIYHSWEFRPNPTEKWSGTDRILLPIFGGRKEGFRGFSKKTNLQEGEWRIRIVTERNQILGSIKFDVVETNEQPALTEERL